MALPALLAAVPAMTKGATGLSQMFKAKKLAKVKRTKYERPEEAKEQEAIARTRAAQTKLPGQERIESQIDRSAANTAEAARKAADPMAFISATAGAEGKAQQAKAELGQAAAQSKDQRQRELMGTLQQQSQYADKEYEENVAKPYARAKATESALRGASIENISGGLSDIAGVASASLLKDKTTPTSTGTTTAQDPAATAQGSKVATGTVAPSADVRSLEGRLAIADREGNNAEVMRLQEELKKLRGY